MKSIRWARRVSSPLYRAQSPTAGRERRAQEGTNHHAVPVVRSLRAHRVRSPWGRGTARSRAALACGQAIRQSAGNHQACGLAIGKSEGNHQAIDHAIKGTESRAARAG
eukprot:2199061-Prymnesium_polylepis.5